MGTGNLSESLEFETMQLRGPEHILGINQKMIARVYPQNGANDAETNYFSYAERRIEQRLVNT